MELSGSTLVPSMGEALGSNSSTTKKEKKEEENKMWCECFSEVEYISTGANPQHHQNKDGTEM